MTPKARRTTQSQSFASTPSTSSGLRRSTRVKSTVPDCITIEDTTDSELDICNNGTSNVKYAGTKDSSSIVNNLNDDDDDTDVSTEEDDINIHSLSPKTTPLPRAATKFNEKKFTDRKLRLKEILGAVNEHEMFLIVKWHGLARAEKVPLQLLRRYHSQEILDFLLSKIRWNGE